MNLNYQKQFTISEQISFSGIGVHSGIESKIILVPANTNSGIKFIKDKHVIDLDINNIEKSLLCTKITNNKVSIFTIEHLLSALYGLGINNINIFVQGEEIPILDGSAKIFVNKIKEKIIVQDIDRDFLKLNQAIYIRDNDKFIIAIPDDRLEISYFLDYDCFPYFVHQNFIYSPQKFINQISQARTYGFLKDVEKLKKMGVALGSSYNNTLVIDDDKYLSKLRTENEIAKHKILDLIGDLAFLKKDLKAKIIAFKTGHNHHLSLVEKIIQLS